MNTKKSTPDTQVTQAVGKKMQSANKISATYSLKIDILLNKAAPGERKV